MGARAFSRNGRPALDMLEDATRLLRSAPSGVLLAYYIGSIPYVLALLYFVADMSRGAFAHQRLVESALGLAALYFWMKCWQTIFARGLLAALRHEPPPQWTPGQLLRMALIQITVQPTGLFLRPMAMAVAIPYVWVYGFYQSAGVLGAGDARLREVLRQSAAQARLWPGQAHAALSYRYGFAAFVLVNVMVFTFLAPQLLKMFFGIETLFTQSPWSLLNSTVLTAIVGTTYLCTDPLRKAYYVLRCFHGSAVTVGDDLRVELRQIRSRSLAAAALLFLLLCGGGAPVARAETPPAASVNATELDRSISDVLQRREFTWRFPREKAPVAQSGWLASFVDDMGRSIKKSIEGTVRAVRGVYRWLRKLFGGSERERSGLGEGWSAAEWAQALTYIALGLLVLVLTIALLRWRRTRRTPIATAEAVPATPDLTSDTVTADQLPEDGWLQLAGELIEAGELRLALRACYLAGLAHLGSRQLITIARHKSNLDYDRELRRRARSREELIEAFDENLRSFERAWYGLHDVTRETLGGFRENLERIRAC